MKILAINGSPNREGTTSGLIDLLIEECEALGAECDKINMEDYQILSCQGCYNCSDKVVCNIDDDFMQLKARVMDADGIIIGSPYYSGKAVDLIEAFIDRAALSAFVTKDFRGKYFVGVSTSAVDDGTDVAEFCANFGDDIGKGGAVVSAVLWEATVLEDGMKELKEDIEVRNKVRKVANKFITDIKSKEKSFFDLIRDKAFPGWLNFGILRIKRSKDFYSRKLFDYLREKGILKDSQKII